MCNFQVAYDVLTPEHKMKPAFLALKVGEMTDRQLLILANLVTMTPGTLSIDFSPDRSRLYVHCMYVDDVEQLTQQIEGSYVKRIKEVF